MDSNNITTNNKIDTNLIKSLIDSIGKLSPAQEQRLNDQLRLIDTVNVFDTVELTRYLLAQGLSVKQCSEVTGIYAGVITANNNPRANLKDGKKVWTLTTLTQSEKYTTKLTPIVYNMLLEEYPKLSTLEEQYGISIVA